MRLEMSIGSSKNHDFSLYVIRRGQGIVDEPFELASTNGLSNRSSLRLLPFYPEELFRGPVDSDEPLVIVEHQDRLNHVRQHSLQFVSLVGNGLHSLM